MLNKLFLLFFPFLALSFAAGAPPLTESGGGADGGADLPSDSSSGAVSDDLGLGDELPPEGADHLETPEGEIPETQVKPEDKDALDFKGSVSRRIAGFIKKNPKLAEALNAPENKEFRDFVEATARRDLAYRELGTIPELRMMREQFPNGMQDVQELLTEVQSVEQLDHDFYTLDQDGKYPGHLTMINNLFSDNREAAISLFKTLPKEWARLDRESYNDVMGQIVGATLAPRLEFVSDLIDAAKQAKQDGLAGGLTKLLNWMENFTAGKPQPTPEEERLNRDRAQFERQRAEQGRTDESRFQQSMNAEVGKVQIEAIHKHPAIAQFLQNQAVPEAKKNEVVGKIHDKIRKFLLNSPSFKSKLKVAYQKRDINSMRDLHKAMWSQPWLLNRMVRDVMTQETPNLVSQNRATLQKRRQTSVQTARPGGERKTEQAKPYQIGKTWYYGDGRKIPMGEILRNGPPQV